MVSSFLDDSSCYSKGIISSSFSKVQYQSYSHGDFSSPFLGDSSIFYVAYAPARSPVVVRQYLPVLATGNIGFVAVTPYTPYVVRFKSYKVPDPGTLSKLCQIHTLLFRNMNVCATANNL
ncbi:Bgt-60025 [Blumeria graminis f. sp. tritici]|uniref:Bgt-60025 n=1 Tax=Blumeria graminis f. sp. tritici TaxID=62690 RepID=A0A9X9MN98_BLUGR|nr:Bgt-60025 [Blumeria graminis f. sp. tritici]